VIPVVSSGSRRIDHTDDGQGELAVLIHMSVSGNRQWRSLTDDVKDRHRVIADPLRPRIAEYPVLKLKQSQTATTVEWL
jgi:hypothetical protein